MFLKRNLPSAPDVADNTSGGFVKLLQSRRRSSNDAFGTGSFVPIATTIPASEAVPGGCGCALCSARGTCARSTTPSSAVTIITNLSTVPLCLCVFVVPVICHSNPEKLRSACVRRTLCSRLRSEISGAQSFYRDTDPGCCVFGRSVDFTFPAGNRTGRHSAGSLGRELSRPCLHSIQPQPADGRGVGRYVRSGLLSAAT